MPTSPLTIEALRQQRIADQNGALAAQFRILSDQQTHSKGTVCMPWPMHNPVFIVPHFNNEAYKNVNLNAQASAHASGLDLPLQDITTLRFFYNLGVQQARAALLSQYNELTQSMPPQQQQPLTQPACSTAFSPYTKL